METRIRAVRVVHIRVFFRTGFAIRDFQGGQQKGRTHPAEGNHRPWRGNGGGREWTGAKVGGEGPRPVTSSGGCGFS